MNVNLTPELEHLVGQKVASGLYNSASEVVREALRLMKEQDELKRIRVDELRGDIRHGLEASAEGRVRDGDEVMSQIKERLSQRRQG